MRTMYAEDVVGDEYRRLSWTRRLLLRWVSPDMHAAARHLSKHPRAHVNVPVFKQEQGAGPVSRVADRMLG